MTRQLPAPVLFLDPPLDVLFRLTSYVLQFYHETQTWAENKYELLFEAKFVWRIVSSDTCWVPGYDLVVFHSF